MLAGVLKEQDVVTVVDMEAGLEHLSRGTGRHVDTLLVTLEPYFKALETARRCAELGRELGIAQVAGVANKVRGSQDRAAVWRYAATHELPLLAEIPFDDAIYQADLAGEAPNIERRSPAIEGVISLAEALHL